MSGTISPAGETRTDTSGSGRAPIGLDLRLTDAAGNPLPDQRNVVGNLQVKGASVVDHYYGSSESVLDQDGYFNTGDLASIDDDGNLTISGRSKDLIKSGGEWINPADIEEIVGQHPDVDLVAVIAAPHEKWGERPLLLVQPRAGAPIHWPELLNGLRGSVPDWWIPDRAAIVQAMPLSGSGKIDKLRLRDDLASGAIAGERIL